MSGDTVSIETVCLVLEGIFAFEILIRFVAERDNASTFKDVAKKYVCTGWFLFDTFTLLPWKLILTQFAHFEMYAIFLKLIRLIKLGVRCYYIEKICQYLRVEVSFSKVGSQEQGPGKGEEEAGMEF